MISRLPLAIACINLSILLLKQFGFFSLSSTDDVSTFSQKPFWPLANTPNFLDQVGTGVSFYIDFPLLGSGYLLSFPSRRSLLFAVYTFVARS